MSSSFHSVALLFFYCTFGAIEWLRSMHYPSQIEEGNKAARLSLHCIHCFSWWICTVKGIIASFETGISSNCLEYLVFRIKGVGVDFAYAIFFSISLYTWIIYFFFQQHILICVLFK